MADLDHFLFKTPERALISRNVCVCVCSSYLVTSYCLVDFALSLKELAKEFVCFGIPLLDFEIL